VRAGHCCGPEKKRENNEALVYPGEERKWGCFKPDKNRTAICRSISQCITAVKGMLGLEKAVLRDELGEFRQSSGIKKQVRGGENTTIQ